MSNLPIEDKHIYIISPRKLQCEMMAEVLEKETGATCNIADDINSLEIDPAEGSVNDALILVDTTGKELESVRAFLEADVKGLSEKALVAMFNMTPGLGIEENIAGQVVRGIFFEGDSLKQFIKGVCAIFDGELWFSREVLTKYVLNNGDAFSPTVKDILTQREIEILSLLAVGTKNEDIAEQLFVSTNTVKTHVYNIFKKIKVTNRLQAALWAAKHL
ncbi:LuxR C-terminal-related transcriptional regulator [Thermodesulfobacteriota bacterium]